MMCFEAPLLSSKPMGGSGCLPVAHPCLQLGLDVRKAEDGFELRVGKRTGYDEPYGEQHKRLGYPLNPEGSWVVQAIDQAYYMMQSIPTIEYQVGQCMRPFPCQAMHPHLPLSGNACTPSQPIPVYLIQDSRWTPTRGPRCGRVRCAAVPKHVLDHRSYFRVVHHAHGGLGGREEGGREERVTLAIHFVCCTTRTTCCTTRTTCQGSGTREPLLLPHLSRDCQDVAENLLQRDAHLMQV